MRLKSGIYEVTTHQLSEDPEQWYWHLFKDGEKINGGLADSEEHALYAAGANRRKDMWVLFR